MITLSVEDYCQNCAFFAPIKSVLYADNAQDVIIISCENAERCRAIAYHILRTKNNSDNEKNS